MTAWEQRPEQYLKELYDGVSGFEYVSRFPETQFLFISTACQWEMRWDEAKKAISHSIIFKATDLHYLSFSVMVS